MRSHKIIPRFASGAFHGEAGPWAVLRKYMHHNQGNQSSNNLIFKRTDAFLKLRKLKQKNMPAMGHIFLSTGPTWYVILPPGHRSAQYCRPPGGGVRSS